MDSAAFRSSLSRKLGLLVALLVALSAMFARCLLERTPRRLRSRIA